MLQLNKVSILIHYDLLYQFNVNLLKQIRGYNVHQNIKNIHQNMKNVHIYFGKQPVDGTIVSVHFLMILICVVMRFHVGVVFDMKSHP